jgi:hypothetical protein
MSCKQLHTRLTRDLTISSQFWTLFSARRDFRSYLAILPNITSWTRTLNLWVSCRKGGSGANDWSTSRTQPIKPAFFISTILYDIIYIYQCWSWHTSIYVYCYMYLDLYMTILIYCVDNMGLWISLSSQHLLQIFNLSSYCKSLSPSTVHIAFARVYWQL